MAICGLAKPKTLIVITNFLLLLGIDDKNIIHKNNFNFETIASLLNTSHRENDKTISAWILYAKKSTWWQ